MLLRTWRTGFDPERLDEFEEFARTRSTPMFESFAGWIGHFHSHTEGEYLTVSLWIGRHAIATAEASEIYRATVAALEATGILSGEQTVEVWELTSLNFMPGGDDGEESSG